MRRVPGRELLSNARFFPHCVPIRILFSGKCYFLHELSPGAAMPTHNCSRQQLFFW